MSLKRRGGLAASASVSVKTESSTLSASLSASMKKTCYVCCQTIHMGKDDRLFCSGTCQQWLHRHCAMYSVIVPGERHAVGTDSTKQH